MSDTKIILIVDDAPEHLKIISSLLKDTYKIKVATNGKKALDIAFSDNPPNLILLDIMMPEMDGYEVCQTLKSNDRTKEIPIIFLTAKANIEDEKKGLELGAVDYITKPISPHILTARVKTHMRLKEVNDLLKDQNVILEEIVQKRTQELVNLNQSLARFVPEEFLTHLNKNSIVEVKLGDQIETEMTILFADIRDFTTVSEQLSPEKNFEFLNFYLSAMGPIIRDHKGFVDKYIGDAIMALFPKSANDALNAAIAMLKILPEHNLAQKKRGNFPISIGIGLHTGLLMLGTVGAYNRMETTVISDAVNLASRMERLTKMYGASLLISDNTFYSLSDPSQYTMRLIDKVTVKGKTKTTSVFEVLDGEPSEIKNTKFKTKEQFEKAISLYSAAEFKELIKIMENILMDNSQDKAAEVYIERCEKNLKLGIKESWTGVTNLDSV
jgi:two-component system, sensor histidine kinase ChiS